MKIKICGLTQADNIRQVLTLRPDYIGFIFYEKSKRYAGEYLPPAFARSLREVEKVGVFVNEPEQGVLERVENYGLDLVQLHGDESPGFCKALKNRGLRIIKAFSIGEAADFEALEGYAPNVDFFLFDAAGAARGGNGVQFDWGLLENYRLNTPFFLAGGIGAEDAGGIRERFLLLPNHFSPKESLPYPTPFALDLNSRFEDSPGLKNLSRLNQFKHDLFH